MSGHLTHVLAYYRLMARMAHADGRQSEADQWDKLADALEARDADQ